jgi:hypothetical protein
MPLYESLAHISSHCHGCSKVKVRVGHAPDWRYKKSAERSRLRQHQWMQARDPVFEEELDFVVDGDTATEPETVVRVEVWVLRTLRGPLFKGSVTLPMREVMAAGRVQNV